MWICAVSCREMLPDPAFFAKCLRDSFEDLKAAAARITTVEHPKPVPRLAGPAMKATARKAAKKKRALKTQARRRAA
jgi:hypothetical protein